jgi:hypothetical protein
LKANPEAVEQQEICNEEMNVDTILALEDWYGNLHLVVWHCVQPEKRFQKELTATRWHDMPCHSCTVQAMYSKEARQGKFNRKNHEKADI